MAGFKPWISGVRSNPSINCDATIALGLYYNSRADQICCFKFNNHFVFILLVEKFEERRASLEDHFNVPISVFHLNFLY